MLSLLQVFAADDSKLDGFNASMYLIDEYHAAKNTGLKDVLQIITGNARQPDGDYHHYRWIRQAGTVLPIQRDVHGGSLRVERK